MTIDLTNPQDSEGGKADGRKRIFRRIDRGEIDVDDPDEGEEWIDEEYVAELRRRYPDYADTDEGEGDRS